jgi:predicted metal-binding membrane protein
VTDAAYLGQSFKRAVGDRANSPSESASHGAFLGMAALLFVLSSVATIVWSKSMSAMGGMPMPGGWSMSMVWMRMQGETWPGVAARFLGMWVVMMVAMMTPCLVPMLLRYRRAVALTGRTAGPANGVPLGRLTAVAAATYFSVWTALGMAIFPLAAALAAIEMQHAALARAVPIAAGMVVLAAGVLQFSNWKAHHLASCSHVPQPFRPSPADCAAAWRHGVRLGVHCVYCCVNLTAVLLVIGVMDLRAMALVTTAVTLERFLPAGARAARGVGAVIVGIGVFLVLRAAGG